MNQELLEKLCDRLNEFEGKVPSVKAFYKLLDNIFSEKEAEIAANFPHGSFTIAELSDFYKKDESVLFPLIETMADKGQVFVVKTSEGESKYELTPWFPGLVEFSELYKMKDPDPKVYEEFSKLQEAVYAEAAELMAPMMADPEAYKKAAPEPGVRVIPVSQSVMQEREVYSFEDVMAMIEKETSFGAMKCPCREKASLTDNPCKITEIPEYSCLNFGAVADYVVERGFGVRLTKQECIDIIKTCTEAGTVLESNNFTEGLQLICNCCPCCCPFMNRIKSIGNLKFVEPSNFVAVVDEDTCTACGECEDRCPIAAISVEDLASVDFEKCIGCGTCTTVCPVEALSMERRADKKPVIGDRMIGLGY